LSTALGMQITEERKGEVPGNDGSRKVSGPEEVKGSSQQIVPGDKSYTPEEENKD